MKRKAVDMAGATTKKAAVKEPRKKLDFSGVPGELVDIGGVELNWGSRQRKSPYDALLRNLVLAGPGKALKFGSERAWASVNVRARKLGITVEPAFVNGALYVRLARKQKTAAEAIEERHATIVEMLKERPASESLIVDALRRRGIDSDGQQVKAALMQESKKGTVQLRADGLWHAAGK